MNVVTDDMLQAALDAYSENEWRTSASAMRAALAAVAPIIAKAERERCAGVADGIVSEYQDQIGDAIESGLRSIEADGLRKKRAAERVATAIRALGDAT